MGLITATPPASTIIFSIVYRKSLKIMSEIVQPRHYTGVETPELEAVAVIAEVPQC